MNYTLKIGATLDVPVSFSLRDGAKDVPFSFSLVANRLSAAELQALGERLKEGGDYGDAEFLAEHVADWRGQRLVLADDGQPAPFSREALDAMCGVVGVQRLLVEKVLAALVGGTKTADADKAKN